MVKKSLAALAVVGGLAVPTVAQADVTAPVAVSGVQLAWAGSGKVRVSWTEQAGIANDVYLEVSGQQAQRIGTTTAAGANELVVPAAALKPTHDATSTARIFVADPSTAGARSAAFDRYIRGETPMGPGMVRGELQWQFAADPAMDATPLDPLDRSEPARILPRLTRLKAGTAAQCEKVQLPATTNRYGAVPRQSGAYLLDLVLANEWGESKLASVRARTSTTSFVAPSAGIYGAKLTMTGAISLRKPANPAAGDCGSVADTGALYQHTMVLHGRNSATDPWYAIGSSKTDAQGKYTFVIANPGAREYRAVLLESGVGGAANYQSISASKVVRATPQVIAAGVTDSVINLGEQPNAVVGVAPYGSHQVALQFKNSSGQWQGLMYRTLSRGFAESGPFPFNRLGTHQFRWWIAATTSSQGLPVDAGYTYPFTLTVQ